MTWPTIISAVSSIVCPHQICNWNDPKPTLLSSSDFFSKKLIPGWILSKKTSFVLKHSSLLKCNTFLLMTGFLPSSILLCSNSSKLKMGSYRVPPLKWLLSSCLVLFIALCSLEMNHRWLLYWSSFQSLLVWFMLYHKVKNSKIINKLSKKLI